MKLEIRDLHAEVEGREVLKGVNLSIRDGEFHVLMGPNGSGKTTLSSAIMGHPKVKVTKGDILLDGKSVLGMPADKRAKLGLFLEFQNPVEIEGLGMVNFLNSAKAAQSERTSFKDLMAEIKSGTEKLHLKEDIIGRSLNHGFSGGEKKKMEILQMRLLKPKMVVLDEPDSGLDVDAVKIVAENVSEFQKESKAGILLITHYARILDYMKPQHVHVLMDGRIVKEDGPALAKEIEKNGYKF
ncbi:putative branched-chain amino acid transport ATP-binding protein LivG [uncultured archaeon]|nr:putative branched-chain amino acid transport ATP-binding protein LivG [uncultured archaeon]